MVRSNASLIVPLFIVIVFAAVFMVYPLGSTLLGAFVVDGQFSLKFIKLALSDPQSLELIFNSVNLALAVTICTLGVSIPLAYVMHRYTFAGKVWLSRILLLPLLLPPFVGAVGMRQIFARFGTLNLLLMKLGIVHEPIDFFGGYGWGGVIIIETLHLYPLAYLNIRAAFSKLDPVLVEAGENLGAHGLKLWRRITLPLVMPGIFAGAALVFIWSLTDLGTPLIFNVREVLPIKIYNMLSDLHENPMAYALVTILLAISLVSYLTSRLLFNVKVLERSARVSQAAEPIRLGTATQFILWSALSVALVFTFLPHLAVVARSVADVWFLSIAPESYTTRHYIELWHHPLPVRSIAISLGLSFLSGFLDIILGVLIAYLVVRRPNPLTRMLGAAAMIPLAVPGVLFAFGYLTAFSGTFLDARVNPLPLLVIAYAVRRLPFIVRSAQAGFEQANTVIEEAAANLGASRGVVLRRITLPILSPHLVAGGILCFAFAMLEVSDSLILASEERFYPITKTLYALVERPDGLGIASALGVLCMLVMAGCFYLSGKILGRKKNAALEI